MPTASLKKLLSPLTKSDPDTREEKKRLRGPAGLVYAISDALEMLDPHAWQALAGHCGLFMGASYLKAMERVLPENITPRYALVYRDEGGRRVPVAAVYMQIARISLAQARREKTAGEAGSGGSLLDHLARNTVQRVLTCGNFLTYGQHGVAFAPDADRALAWHGVAEALYRVRQAEKLAGRPHFVMIKDLHEPYVEHAACLQNLSYRYVETEPNMVLALEDGWRHYDDYLASLASKYRTKVRNAVFKVLDDAGCTVEHLADVRSMQGQIHALYKSVQVNADFRPIELRPDYFAALQDAAGDGFRCSVLKRGDALLGFLISVADSDTSVAMHIGFDRAAAADLPIYLRLLHAGIADALALGCKRISYGRTALEPKATIGAKPQPFGVLVRHRQPILNKVIKHPLLKIQHAQAPERNPFKKAV